MLSQQGCAWFLVVVWCTALWLEELHPACTRRGSGIDLGGLIQGWEKVRRGPGGGDPLLDESWLQRDPLLGRAELGTALGEQSGEREES